VQPKERILILDILRGFAVFGILAVNIKIFSLPNQDFSQLDLGSFSFENEEWYNQFSRLFNEYFTEGKFYTIFSFLFGLGFSVQLSRAETKGTNFIYLYSRRLLILLAIGILHSLLWWGDILKLYAVLGFGLLFFRKLSNKVLLILAVLFVAFAGLVTEYPSVFGRNDITPSIDNVLSIFSNLLFGIIQMGPTAMAMFLLGRVVGRIGFFEKLPQNISVLKKIMIFGLLVTVIAKVIVHFFVEENSGLETILKNISDIGLSSVYVAVISYLTMRSNTAKFLKPLSSVGRMALTNYIAQTVICVSFFYVFDLAGKLQDGWILIISILIYILQILYSNWWLKRFKYGPLEWLWRSLTFGKKQSFLLDRTFK
jgi:uncharacterized protein